MNKDDKYSYYNEETPEKINAIRDSAGLPPIKVKERNCLHCDTKFTSMGVGNRLCRLCRKRD